ncbi:hypothetical protein N7462_000454 [Penicillium macrosclerotiorum]|uniref:uncharacterized protein n=1 Tax=Penicillium macrosclerotiorum TaxID=303699 RepID=UPI002546D0D8|nr:uncharacterized protein N7462_000454 [Penicillium macrosclerotiorum]KAJ5698449.1 hypothetical protein N7462_000454 [Penicillium macrosclerotiorum]
MMTRSKLRRMLSAPLAEMSLNQVTPTRRVALSGSLGSLKQDSPLIESYVTKENIPMSQDIPARAQACPLTRVPLDCWLQVLECLHRRDVSAVSMASKQLRASAEPILYRVLFWEWFPIPFLQILKLLRTFYERPELAVLVQHVSFTVSYPDNPFMPFMPKDEWKKDLRGFATVRNFALSIIRQGNFANGTQWKEALNEGQANAYAAILISQLHGLQTLKLDCSFVLDHGYPGLMMTQALLHAPAGVMSDFTRLRVVDYGNNSPRLMAYNAEQG